MTALPYHSFLPAPLWVITVLAIATLTLHFAAMNFLFGGLIVILLGRFEDRWNHPVVRAMVKLFPSAAAATVTLGVAPLLFLQLVFYQQAYSAAIVSAWWWLAIVGAVIVAYYLFYAASFAAAGGNARRLPACLGVALLSLLFVSLVYSTVFSLAERPDLYHLLYADDPSGTAVNPAVGSWIFRWLHVVLGAVGVGAFFVGVVGRQNDSVFRVARGILLWGMVAAMAGGLAYLLSLGEHVAPLMRSVAGGLLGVSIVLTVGAIYLFFKKKFIPSGSLLFASLLAMVAIRHLLRLLLLEGAFDPAAIPVSPQWSVFGLFLACFVIMIGAVWTMLALFARGSRQTL